LGAQRLLPLSQQLYQGWGSVLANRSLINEVTDYLDLPAQVRHPKDPPMPFERRIHFDRVSYLYRGRGAAAVSELSFSIRRGSRVALVGPTGAGKSTTADLLMGLLVPTQGRIFIDDVELTDLNRQTWRANVAHVPQSLFLADASISQNIALGADPDLARVREAVTAAELSGFISSLPEGLDTRVGEEGVRISGGQRQRLAIARAIYKNTSVLVFDEATSALDADAEGAILSTFDRLQEQGRTIIIIAHSATAVAGCDHIIRLVNGRVDRT
jgi:ATP-binding cassette subfamily B protein